MAKHKIGYYILCYKLVDETEGNLADMLSRVLTYIDSLDRVDRKRNDFTNQDKFAYLSSFTVENSVIRILLKSATHSYRAPLIHKDTLNERPNPKQMEEGEQIKTHIVIDTNTGYVTKDTLLRGVAINAFVTYLNSFLSGIFEENEIAGTFEYYDVPSDNFRDEIDRMNRVTMAEITTDKQILGSPALGYNDRLEEVQDEISITIKSHRRGSIKDRVLNMILPSLNDNRVRRVKIRGKDEFGNDRTLDSLNMLKITFIDIEKDQATGEFDSASMFSELTSVLPRLQ